jgi:hypothetical protein
MRLEGDVELVYELTAPQTLQDRSLRLTIEFLESLAGTYHLKLTTRINDKEQTHTERNLSDPFVWAIEQISRGPIDPSEENLPLALTQDLVVSSVMLFHGVFKEPSEWESGFSVPHPAPQLSESRFVATTERCEEAGIEGKTMRVTGELGSAVACISPSHGLPLKLSKTSSTFGTQEYRLVSYRIKPLELKPTFYQGEPKGFDEISWGTNIAEVKGLNLKARPHEAVAIYQRIDRRKRFWGVRFDTVDYRFERERFVGVVAKLKGGESWASLLESLHQQYGRSERLRSQVLDGSDQFLWSTDTTTQITIDYPGDDGNITVRMSSVELGWHAWDDVLDDLDFP